MEWDSLKATGNCILNFTATQTWPDLDTSPQLHLSFLNDAFDLWHNDRTRAFGQQERQNQSV